MSEKGDSKMEKEDLERLKKGEEPEDPSGCAKIVIYIISGIVTLFLFGLFILVIGLLKS